MMKISTLLAINILVATSLIVAYVGSNAIYGQATQQNPTISPQPIRPDQQAAAQQQQAAAAQLQQQQAAAAQQQQAAAAQQQQAQQQAATPQQQQAQQQAAQQAQQQAATQPQTNQTSTQPQTNQTSTSSSEQQSQGSSSGQSGNLDTKALLNYTNNAVLALHGTHTSEAKQKIAEDNLAKIQQLLLKANPKLLPLSPSAIP